jgi:hypothetical protein
VAFRFTSLRGLRLGGKAIGSGWEL